MGKDLEPAPVEITKNGALQDCMQSSTALEVADMVTLATFQDGSKVILIDNNLFF